MKIWHLVRDNGDGSSSTVFFDNEATPMALVDESKETFDDAYTGNEGDVSSFEIPDGPNTINFYQFKLQGELVEA